MSSDGAQIERGARSGSTPRSSVWMLESLKQLPAGFPSDRAVTPLYQYFSRARILGLLTEGAANAQRVYEAHARGA